MSEAALDHVEDHVVRDEFAAVHEACHVPPERRPRSHRVAEDLPGVDGWDAERGGQALRLGSLAHPRRPEEEHPR